MSQLSFEPCLDSINSNAIIRPRFDLMLNPGSVVIRSGSAFDSRSRHRLRSGSLTYHLPLSAIALFSSVILPSLKCPLRRPAVIAVIIGFVIGKMNLWKNLFFPIYWLYFFFDLNISFLPFVLTPGFYYIIILYLFSLSRF